MELLPELERRVRLGLNEADSCRVYVSPALQEGGWGNPTWQIAEQHHFSEGTLPADKVGRHLRLHREAVEAGLRKDAK